MNTQSAEDSEAFQKWCEERERLKKESEQKERLMRMYEEQEKARKEMMEKEKAERDARERHEAMLAQYNEWQMKLTQVQHFEKIEYELQELNHKYMYAITTEVLKFCNCDDWIDDLGKYFNHEGFTADHDDWDLDDLESVDYKDNSQIAVVAEQTYRRSEEDRTKLFFGGVSRAFCNGARSYLSQVMQWDMDRGFMDKL